jgi:hypothetical protein
MARKRPAKKFWAENGLYEATMFGEGGMPRKVFLERLPDLPPDTQAYFRQRAEEYIEGRERLRNRMEDRGRELARAMRGAKGERKEALQEQLEAVRSEWRKLQEEHPPMLSEAHAILRILASEEEKDHADTQAVQYQF